MENKSESKQVVYLDNMYMKIKLMHIAKAKNVIKIITFGSCKSYYGMNSLKCCRSIISMKGISEDKLYYKLLLFSIIVLTLENKHYTISGVDQIITISL